MNALLTVEEASRLIGEGRPLLVAGDGALLERLPRGRWIGGTIPYFMSDEGGLKTPERLFVTSFPELVAEAEPRLYRRAELASIPSHYPRNGASFVVVPASSSCHVEFAQRCTSWPGVFDGPLVGWVTGVDLADLGRVAPLVFNGSTGESSADAAVVMHVALPSTHAARVDIVNIFTQGDGDVLVFPADGFEVSDVLVNGERRNFARYVAEKAVDTKLPLVADYNGAMVNISFQSVDAASGKVRFYAPVFEGVTYRLARPLGEEYPRAFDRQLVARVASPAFGCNCILNYVYGGLEGKRTGAVTGPITFGEIAYMLLNQTMVLVDFQPV